MILNLMTKSQFERAIGNYNPFAQRWKSIKDIVHSVGQAHEISGRPGQFIALMGLLRLCYAWKVEYRRRKSRSWTLSRRGPGVHLLEAQISALFRSAFSEEYFSFRKKTIRAGAAFQTLTGIGSSDRPALRFPNTTRMLSATNYVLEFLEPRHRAFASELKDLWDRSDDGLCFADFVNNLDPTFLSSFDHARLSPEGQQLWVHYLSSSDRDSMELKPVRAGNSFARDLDGGRLFDTAVHSFQAGSMGMAIFVMDEQNRIYSHSKSVDRFHHSSFLGGRPTKSAGMIRVNDGVIVNIVMRSGHYKPETAQALAICRALLVKFSGNSGTPYDKDRFKDSAPNSIRAQSLLSRIHISPDHTLMFYNALEYLKAGGQTSGLRQAQAIRRR
jgi:hypothetical protein